MAETEATEAQPANAASHTYDQGYKRWEQFTGDDSDDDSVGGPPSGSLGSVSDEEINTADDAYNDPPAEPTPHVPNPDPEHELSDEAKAAMEDISGGGDGSLLKTVLTAGDGSGSTPPNGANVKCHYTGRLLDGQKFDSSRDRDEPFGFKVGTGVITGWSEGVSTMEVGEVARFCIGPEKAYGKAGSPPKIPPDATLQFDIELISFSEYDDVAGTHGNVQRKVTIDGTGWKHPKDQDICMVHMKVSLEDGTMITEVGSEETPGEYVIDAGQGWSAIPNGIAHALKGMKQGAKSEFIIQPSYGYGVDGCDDPKVPPNAVLKAEIELFTFIEVKDITPKESSKKNRIKLKIFDEGTGYKMPKDLSTVNLHYSMKLADGTVVFDTHADGNVDPISHVMDEGQDLKCPAIELALKEMKQGAKAEVKVAAEYAQCDAATAVGVPDTGNPAVTVILELVDFIPDKESWEYKDDDEKIEAANTKKTMGNDKVKGSDFARALRRYESAKSIISSDHSFTEAQKAKAKELKLAIWCNMALCQEKLGQDRVEVIKSCNEALKLDANCVKALYRRGCVASANADFDSAKSDLKAALAHDPDSAPITKALAVLKKRIAAQDSKDRETLGGMFDKFAAQDAKKKAKQKQKVETNTGNLAPGDDAAKIEEVTAMEEVVPEPEKADNINAVRGKKRQKPAAATSAMKEERSGNNSSSAGDIGESMQKTSQPELAERKESQKPPAKKQRTWDGKTLPTAEDLQALPRKKLQALAKKMCVRANLKTEKMVTELLKCDGWAPEKSPKTKTPKTI